MKSFVTSQFSHCPLIWMFHSRRLNNKMYSIHKRAFRIAHQENTSTFQELLNKDNTVSIHYRNLQVLATECPKQVRIIFAETILLKNVKCTLYITVLNRYRFVGPKIWDLIPVELKQSETLYSFKLKIKNWVPFECPCRICKTYIQQVRFL